MAAEEKRRFMAWHNKLDLPAAARNYAESDKVETLDTQVYWWESEHGSRDG